MNDLNTKANTEGTEGTEPEVVEVATPSIPTTFFAGETLADAHDAVEIATLTAETEGVKVAQNFKDGEELPDGFGLLVRPVSKRGKGLQGVVVAAMPTLEAILAHEKGEQFVRDAMLSVLSDKLVAAVRGRGDDAVFGGTMPFTLADFLAPAKRDGGLPAFNIVANLFVQALKKKGAKKMTKGLLRQICESTAFAEAEFPTVGQEQWVNVINTMASKATKEGESDAIFNHWLATRDQVEIVSDDLNLDDLSGLLG